MLHFAPRTLMLKTTRMRARTLSMLLCLLALSSASALAKTPRTAKPKPSNLGQTISAILSNPAVARAHWGISVVALDGTPIYALNDQQYFQPASNAKLFTTAAALALLGPDFTMKTYVVASGPITTDGHLSGSLRLIGGGDPTLSGRSYPYGPHTDQAKPPLHALDDLATQVASHIHALDGSIVADDTLFAFERYGTGWAQDDLQW